MLFKRDVNEEEITFTNDICRLLNERIVPEFNLAERFCLSEPLSLTVPVYKVEHN